MAMRTRREFLAEVGRGMLAAGVGASLAGELGLGTVWAADKEDALNFGKLEPLVAFLQETPTAKLLPALVEKLKGGTELKELVAAAALANARTFGGEDYVGFHAFMAMSPAYHMANEAADERKALPVLKVLYRSCNRIQEKGGRKDEVLRPVKPADMAADKPIGETIRGHTRKREMSEAEAAFAARMKAGNADGYNDLLVAVEDAPEVHRVVLAYRAWDMLELAGPGHAHALLRQSLRYCVRGENENQARHFKGPRELLPKLLEKCEKRIAEWSDITGIKSKAVKDDWVKETADSFFRSNPEQAAEMATLALVEGIGPDALGEAIVMAANQLVLRDRGRPANQANPAKPEGSVHGDSIGVHACDSANAWRNIAAVSNPRNRAAALILAAWQVASDRGNRGGDFLKWEPYPLAEHLEKIQVKDAAKLLAEADAAIRNKDQAQACALVHRYGDLGHPPKPIFELLWKYAVSEDGALHAEKYYRTVADEFATLRPAFQWRQLAALARVTASEYGYPAPGYKEACELLKVKA